MVRTPFPDTSGLKKGTWTPQEDKKLIAYVTRYGSWNWRQIPRFAGLARCGKSCRLRWLNYLRPNIKRGNYTAEEEEVIIRLHEKLGNKWSVIATHLPGRTDNEIKNHWHANLKKRFGKNSDGHNENVKATKSNTSGSTQDKKDSIENFHGNSSSTTSKACDSGRLSSDFTTVVTDENLSLENEFDFVDACLEEVDENLWTELCVGNIFNTPMSDNGNGNGNFDGSDATRTMDAWRLSDSNENLVVENDDFAFLEAMTANFWIEASAAHMFLVPNE